MRKIATVFSAELEGIQARTIEVEVDLNVGLHAFTIVGLADKALNEARERVNSALKNSGAKPPNRENRKITVNLAPADVRKTGSQYDLAIALGYLEATGQMPPFNSQDKIFVGELALDGRLRPISGALSIAEMAARCGFQYLFLPRANANEAAAISGIKIIAIDHLRETMSTLAGKTIIEAHVFQKQSQTEESAPDLADIRGQHSAKRALLIAASGGHNLLMNGPPGVGKSSLAQALSGILPELSLEESIEVTKIWSVAGLAPPGLISRRPFRSPHQTISLRAMIGGGGEPRPGEISLAHRGVLFLDELPEFKKEVLEALRGPLESGSINIARIRDNLIFPARLSLVAAMNPCPCGFQGDTSKECVCSPYEILKYQKNLSGPLLDRIDLQMNLQRVPLSKLRSSGLAESTSDVAKVLVAAARARQESRFRGARPGLRTNADMNSREAETMAKITPEAQSFLSSFQDASLSPRGYYRLLKTARTIADLEGREGTTAEDLAEAWSYRLRAPPAG